MPDTSRWSARAPKGGYESYKGGQFIPRSVLETEKRIAQEAFSGLQSEFNKDLQFLRAVSQLVTSVGKTDLPLPPPLSVKTVEDRVVRAIRSYYSRAFLLGKRAGGNLLSISRDERTRLRAVRVDEYKYMRRFLRDIQTGAGKIPYEKRMQFYTYALREAFWLGFTLANQDTTRRIFWYFGNTIEHCTDCQYFASRADGWPIADFMREAVKTGKLPQSGSLECKGLYCQCYLTDKPVVNKNA